MVYIYEKKINGQSYYYLRESFRIKNKISSRDLAYLGKNPDKINIESLTNKFGNKIKKTKSIEKFLRIKAHENKIKNQPIKENKYFDKSQLSEINKILSHFKFEFEKFSKKTQKEIKESISIQFIKENTSMEFSEKNPMTFNETKKLLNEGTYPKNKLISNMTEILNTKKILNILENKKPKINTGLIAKIHDELINNIYKTKGLRTHEIKIKGNKFKTSPAQNIQTELKKLINWLNKNKNKIHPLALAVLFHHKFEKIHPFTEGNGETGRILMNYILSKLNYPPITLPTKKEKEYHNCMNKAYPCLKTDLLNTDMKYYKPLIDFMHKQFVKTYWENFI